MPAVAVLGCVITMKPTGGETLLVTSSPSTSVTAGGLGVYAGSMDVLVTNYNVPGAVTSATGTVTILPSNVGVEIAEGQLMAENDTGTGEIKGTNPSTGAAVTIPVSLTIQNAGQVGVEI